MKNWRLIIIVINIAGNLTVQVLEDLRPGVISTVFPSGWLWILSAVLIAAAMIYPIPQAGALSNGSTRTSAKFPD